MFLPPITLYAHFYVNTYAYRLYPMQWAYSITYKILRDKLKVNPQE